MSIKGVIINRGKPGANVLSGSDGTSALVVNGPEVVAAEGVSGVDAGVVYTLFGIKDAEAMGLTAAYDYTNDVRVHYHIAEFYRRRGEGTKLYLVMYSASETMIDAFGDEYAKKAIIEANGEICQMGFAYNPASGYSPTYVDGLEADIRECIPAAQNFYDWADETFRPVQIVLEGRGFNATGATALDLRNISTNGVVLKAHKVSLCIGQDWDYAETLDDIGKQHAAVGTLLGDMATVAVNQNVGEVETREVSDAVKVKFLTCGLSNHKKLSEVENDLGTLDAKGYIFLIRYANYSGHFWNGDHTCTPVEVDSDGNMNEFCIAYGRTMDKARKTLRTALLPKVKTVQPVDSATGKLPTGVVKYFEGIGDKALGRMEAAFELSAGKTYVDANSNLLIPPRELKVSFTAVPYGTVDEIKGTINLKTNL